MAEQKRPQHLGAPLTGATFASAECCLYTSPCRVLSTFLEAWSPVLYPWTGPLHSTRVRSSVGWVGYITSHQMTGASNPAPSQSLRCSVNLCEFQTNLLKLNRGAFRTWGGGDLGSLRHRYRSTRNEVGGVGGVFNMLFTTPPQLRALGAQVTADFPTLRSFESTIPARATTKVAEYLYIYIYTHTYTCICASILYIYMYTHIHIYIYIYVSLSLSLSTYIYIYI